MTIAHGPIVQTAWVTEKIDVTETFFTEHFGVRNWTRLRDIPFGPDSCTYRGKPADFSAHISLSYLGDMQLELIQPIWGANIYTDFLDTRGQGLHHICFEPDDYDAALDNAAAAGLEVVQRGSLAGGVMDFAYLDGAAAGVPYIELARLGPDMRSFYAQVRAHSADPG